MKLNHRSLVIIVIFLGVLVGGCSKQPINSAAQQALPTIENINISKEDSGLKINIISSQPNFTYTAYKLTEPLRLAIDIPNVLASPNLTEKLFTQDPILRIKPTTYGENHSNLRVELLLSQDMPYSIQKVANTVSIAFNNRNEDAQAPEGNLVASLADTQTEPERETPATDRETRNFPQPGNETQETRNKEHPKADDIIRITNANVASKAKKMEPLEAAELVAQASEQQPSQTATQQATQAPKSTKQEAPQSWDQYLKGLEAMQETTDDGTPIYRGAPISIDIKDGDILDILRHIGAISGFNVVVDPEVRGTVTLHLENVPWDQVLDIILKNNGLGKEFQGNVMRIATMDKLRREEEARKLLREAQIDAAPLHTRVVYLSYADAGSMKTLLEKNLSRRGHMTVDNRTNSVIITDLYDHVEKIEKFIRILDKRTKQVSINARYVTATKSFSRSLGINWGFNQIADAAHGNTTKYAFPYTYDATGAVNLIDFTAPGELALDFGDILDTFKLEVRLALSEAEGTAKTISNPRVTTADNVAANITSGVEVPYAVPGTATVGTQAGETGAGTSITGQVTTFWEFRRADISLNVTPHITNDYFVDMKIAVSNNTVDDSFTPPRINTATATAQVLVEDGDTFVIGSFKQTTSGVSSMKVPWFHKIPIVGLLFKNSKRSNKFTDLLIFLTPTVIKQKERTIKKTIIE